MSKNGLECFVNRQARPVLQRHELARFHFWTQYGTYKLYNDCLNLNRFAGFSPTLIWYSNYLRSLPAHCNISKRGY